MPVASSGDTGRVLTVEADDLVSPETFARIQQHYWISAWKNERNKPFWWDWVFSLSEPRPVPNPNMTWRRPTYEEAVEREWWFRNDRDHWDRCISEYGGRLRRYCQPESVSAPASSPSEASSCNHDASYGNGDGTRTCILAGCGATFGEASS